MFEPVENDFKGTVAFALEVQLVVEAREVKKLGVLSVTTFWSFQREFSRRTDRQLPISTLLIDPRDRGTKMGPWETQYVRRTNTTTVSRSSFARLKTSLVPLDAGSLDLQHAAGSGRRPPR